MIAVIQPVALSMFVCKLFIAVKPATYYWANLFFVSIPNNKQLRFGKLFVFVGDSAVIDDSSEQLRKVSSCKHQIGLQMAFALRWMKPAQQLTVHKSIEVYTHPFFKITLQTL